MSLSTTYTKAETDYLIQQLEIKTSSGYQGDLLKTDAAPTTKGFYALLETGIYPNLGNINAEAGKLNFASFDGTTWSKVEVDMPKGADGKTIENWSAKSYTVGSNIFYNEKIYANDTAAAVAADVPGVSAVWVEKVGGNADEIYDKAIEQKLGVTHDKDYIGATAGTDISTAAATRFNNLPIEGNGNVTEISFFAAGAATTFIHIHNDGTQWVTKNVVSFGGLTANTQYTKSVNIPVEAGDLIGIYIDNTTPFYYTTSGGTYFTGQAGLRNIGGTVSGLSTAAGNFRYSFRVHYEGMTGTESTDILMKIKKAGGVKTPVQSYDAAIAEKAGEGGLVLYTSGAISESVSVTKQFRCNNLPFKNNGTLAEIAFKAGATSQYFVLVEKSNSGNWISKQTIIFDGLTVGQEYVKPTNIDVKKGQMLGIWVESGLGQYFSSAGSHLSTSAKMYIGGTEGALIQQSGSFSYTFKIDTVGLTGDESIELIKKLKKAASLSDQPGIIYASSKGVSEIATAAENTAILNSLIEQAHATKSVIILPNGTIKHNGLIWREGVIMRGMGMTHTILLNDSGTFAIRDLDTQNQNTFGFYGEISDMTIDGKGTTEYGLDLRAEFYMKVSRVVFRRFTTCVRYEGMLVHYFESVKFQESVNGFIGNNATGTSVGRMDNNLCRFDLCYFAVLSGWCVQLNGSSNVTFNSCNFESCGNASNASGGGVKTAGMSAGGQGIDLIMNSCWSENMFGTWVELNGNVGTSVIRDCMCWKMPAAKLIRNNGSKLLITGAIYMSNDPQQVVTSTNGITRVSTFKTDITHFEISGGQYQQVNFV